MTKAFFFNPGRGFRHRQGLAEHGIFLTTDTSQVGMACDARGVPLTNEQKESILAGRDAYEAPMALDARRIAQDDPMIETEASRAESGAPSPAGDRRRRRFGRDGSVVEPYPTRTPNEARQAEGSGAAGYKGISEYDDPGEDEDEDDNREQKILMHAVKSGMTKPELYRLLALLRGDSEEEADDFARFAAKDAPPPFAGMPKTGGSLVEGRAAAREVLAGDAAMRKRYPGVPEVIGHISGLPETDHAAFMQQQRLARRPAARRSAPGMAMDRKAAAEGFASRYGETKVL